MFGAIARTLFGGSAASATPAARQRLAASGWPAAIYAIGDVHGCLPHLQLLEERIIADGAALSGEKWLVLLGDYVDRGPDSAGVIEHILAKPPAGYRRICLAGNHETLMLDFLGKPTRMHDWLSLGGDKTLESYGIDMDQWVSANWSSRQRQDMLFSHIPSQHLDLLKTLPACLSVGNTVFVHAGLRRGVPIAQQTEADMFWMRPGAVEDIDDGVVVVHGHTPSAAPFLSRARIGIDTGAFATGILTAIRLTPDGGRHLLDTRL